MRVGQQITGEWEKVARLLEPQPLDRNSIVAIQKCERDPEEQAQKMLDEWYKKHGNEATRYRLIKALIEAEKKAIAESVFGGLVKAVEQVRVFWRANRINGWFYYCVNRSLAAVVSGE